MDATMDDATFTRICSEYNHLNIAMHYRKLSDTERARQAEIEAFLETL